MSEFIKNLFKKKEPDKVTITLFENDKGEIEVTLEGVEEASVDLLTIAVQMVHSIKGVQEK